MANYTENYDLVKPTMAETADIRTINGNMDTVDTIMHDTQVSMADAFDSTASYAIRDLVMYEFKLYQCIHPHEGPWDADNWVRVNAAETGGNYVEITPTYNSGLKIADTNIDGDQDEIDVPYFGGATAQANGTGGAVPAPTSSDVGKFLSSNGGWETPSGGGGGTTVVPNPVGEPTDELDTIRIGDTIFSIPGSGGGSYKEAIIYSGSATQATYQLSSAISTFDFIWIGFARSNDFETSIMYPSSYLVDAITTQSKIGAATDDKYSFFTVTSETLLTRQNEDDLHIVMVKGLNLGGVMASQEVIWEGTADQTNVDYTTTKSIEDYDFLIMEWSPTDLPNEREIDWEAVGALTGYGTNTFVYVYYSSCYARGRFKDSTTFILTQMEGYGSTRIQLKKILGVKLGGGSGSGGGYSETDLFVNTGSSNPASIVMVDSIQNYDEIVFFVTRNAYGNTYKLQFRYTTSGLALGDVIQCWCWGPNNEYFSYELTAFDTFSNMAQGNALLCTKIIGIKH